MEATFGHNAIITLSIMSTMMFVGVSSVNINVGGTSGWSLYSNMTEWSASVSFLVNDSIVFIYTPEHDVIEVNEADFSLCRISSPIATYSDGETTIFLGQPGRRYFVCGRSYHCAMGLKLKVDVQQTLNSNHNVTGFSNNAITPISSYSGVHQTSPVPSSSNGCDSLGGYFMYYLGMLVVIFYV